MARLLDVISARLLEGSLMPYLGPSLHHLAPFPASAPELSRWLAARCPVPGHLVDDLEATASWIEAQHGRRGLVKLLREAFAAHALAGPLHLLLAGLPRLPLVVSAWYDGTCLDVLLGSAREGGRSVALVHGVSPLDGRGVFFCASEAPGLTSIAEADTVLYQPLGICHPAPSFLVSQGDLSDLRLALPGQAPVPPEVQRRRDGGGFLLVGCALEDPLERMLARGVMSGTPGPHVAVLPGPVGPETGRFLEELGIVPLEQSAERFVAELSRRLACASALGRGGAAPRPFST